MMRETAERYMGAGVGGGGAGAVGGTPLRPSAPGAPAVQESEADRLRRLLEGLFPSLVPSMAAPGISQMRQYGYGAMDLASRAGSVQAGNAMLGLGGLNPQARASAMSQISQSAMAPAASAGVQGYLGGGGFLQGAGQANLGAMMGERNMLTGALMTTMGLTSQEMMQMRELEQMRKQADLDRWMRDKERKSAMWGSIGQGLGQIGGQVIPKL